MKTIHRFTLEPVDKDGFVTIELPGWADGGCSILHVETLINRPMIWVLLNTEAKRVPWLFKLVRTGEDAENCYEHTYIGTVIVDNQSVHIFQGVR